MNLRRLPTPQRWSWKQGDPEAKESEKQVISRIADSKLDRHESLPILSLDLTGLFYNHRHSPGFQYFIFSDVLKIEVQL